MYFDYCFRPHKLVVLCIDPLHRRMGVLVQSPERGCGMVPARSWAHQFGRPPPRKADDGLETRRSMQAERNYRHSSARITNGDDPAAVDIGPNRKVLVCRS